MEKEIKEKATKIIGRTTRQIPYIVIMLFSLCLTGIVELITLGWSWETLKDANFWGNMLITNVASFLMAISSTLMNSDNIGLDTSKGLGKQAYELNDVVIKASANVKNDIDIFIMVENEKRKIKKYKWVINRKITKLESRFKLRDSNEYALYLKGSEDFDIKKTTKKVLKRIELGKLLDENYIKEHIKYINVKYNKISRKMIENGSQKFNDDGTLVKGGVVLINGILPKFILSFSLTLIITSFTYDSKDDLTWAIIIPIMTKIITLLFNYNYGRTFAPNYFNETIIGNLQVRREWLTKYNEWRENNYEKEKV